MKMDKYLEELGYERISLNRVTGLDDAIHQGIDGVYYNPNGNPQYIIAEAKYGTSQLSTLKDGTRQMEEKWIEARLQKVLDADAILDIWEKGYESILTRISPEGKVTISLLDSNGYIVVGGL